MRNMVKYGIVVLAAVSLAAVSCGRGGNSQAGNQAGEDMQDKSALSPVIAVSDQILMANVADTIDLGLIGEGDLVDIDAKLYNAGNKPFVVVRVDKTCGCVDLEYPRGPLKPGEYAKMPMTFDAKGLSGFVYKTVTLQTSLNAKLHLLVVRAEVR